MDRMILPLTLLLILAVACAPQPVVCPDGSKVRVAEDCPIVQEAQRYLDEVEEAYGNLPTGDMDARDDDGSDAAPAAPARSAAPSGEIAELIGKSEAIKSFSFWYAPVEEASSGMVIVEQANYFVKGTKAKVLNVVPKSFDKTTFVDTVYVDYVAQTARGYCTEAVIRTCAEEGEERKAKFSDYDIKMPPAWLEEIPNGATISDGPTFYSRSTRRVRFEEDGQYHEMLLDKYYGMPLSVKVYSDEEYKLLVDGVEYRKFAFNTVTDADVTDSH